MPDLHDEHCGTTESPIFIVGMDRSGTTLMSALLDAHPRIAIAPETWFMSHWYAPHAGLDLRDRLSLEQVLARGIAHDFFPHLGIDAAALTREVLGGGDPTFAGIFAAMMRAYAGRFGKARWGEKTPHHYRHARVLLDWYPGVRLIFMVRDPRAVYASFARTPYGHAWTDKQAREWSDYIWLTRQLTSDPRVLAVRYEDLAERPGETLGAVCSFIGEEFTPAMLDRSTAVHRLEGHDGWRLDHERKAIEPITTASVNAWQDKLAPYQIAIIEHYAGELMESLGYRRTSPGLGFGWYCRMNAGRLRRNARHWISLAGARLASPPRNRGGEPS